MLTHLPKCTKCSGDGHVVCPRCKGKRVEPKEIFYTKPLSSWDEIHGYKAELEKESWIFRGQADSTWPLETSLRLSCEGFQKDLKNPKKAEFRLCREFRRRLHHYSVHIPKEDDYLEWFSLMQHYGAPTRLLDFTYSMHIAAFFALENAKSDCAVWAINTKWAIKQSALKFAERSRECRFILRLITEKDVEVFKKVFMRSRPTRFACPINPFKLNERLTIQKGVFLCPGNVSRSLEDNLCALKDYDSKKNVRKFIIPLADRRRALDDLYNLNITHTTLFPGLEGFARSLGISPPKILNNFGRDS